MSAGREFDDDLLAADIHTEFHDSICGDDPDSCLTEAFWLQRALNLRKLGALRAALPVPALDALRLWASNNLGEREYRQFSRVLSGFERAALVSQEDVK